MFNLRKLRTYLRGEDVFYEMKTEEDGIIILNDFLGKRIKIVFQNKIFCLHCGRQTNKSFNQGYCFPCFKRLPSK